jgi:MFS family permease
MVAMIAGPLVGGYITDTLSWRWIFYINMPIGGAALVYLWATLHLPRRRVEHKVDYLGAVVIGLGATAITLLATWGGTQYAWGSWEIMTLGAVIAVSLAAFFVVEGRAAEPILPLHVFRNRNFSLSTAMSFLLGFVMLGGMTFLPLYQQTVQHASPTTSGLLLIPLMFGSMVTSLIGGRITLKTGRYKMLPIIGGAVMTVAIYLLTHLGPHTSRLESAIFYVTLGLGMGFLMQIVSLIVQNSVEPKDMGVASSARMFFQQIGGSMGVSLLGVIFFHRLTSVIAANLPGAQVHPGQGSLDPATINTLPAVVRDVAFLGISKGLDLVYWWTIPATALVFLLALWVKEIPLRGGAEGPVAAPAAERAEQAEPAEPANLGAI